MGVNQSKIVAPSFVRRDNRGLFVEIVDEGPWETIIHGTMEPGSQMGNHYHKENKALFYLMSGSATVAIKRLVDKTEEEIKLVSGQGIYFMPYEVHTIAYDQKSDFLLLKSYRYRKDSPDIFLE